MVNLRILCAAKPRWSMPQGR